MPTSLKNLLAAASIAVLLVMTPFPALADNTETLQKTLEELKKAVADQQKVIADLEERIRQLETHKAQGEENAVPPVEIPDIQPHATPPAPKASYIPDIAVIGNHIGTYLVPRGYSSRNRFQLSELELALQQPVYTGVNFYAAIAGEADNGFSMGVEEAYVTLSRPFKLPFDGVAGKRHIQFGKANALHPHQWHYVDQPAPLAAFLGPEGLYGNGASINYTFPSRALFANLELGFWGSAEAHEHESAEASEPGAGISGDMPVARLWLSKALADASEIELGASHAFGKAHNGDLIHLTGLDLSYKRFPSTFSRLQLQGEVFWHARKDEAERTGTHTRSGHYALLTYAPDQYYDYGVRYDNTRYPWPIRGREQSLSLILSNRLTEATFIRLQYKFGDRTTDVLLPARKGFSEVYLQFIWGAGSHTHPLQ